MSALPPGLLLGLGLALLALACTVTAVKLGNWFESRWGK